MRKEIFISVAILFNSIALSSAQITFQKIFDGMYGDAGRSVQQTADGGYVIGGFTQKVGALLDIYLIRTDLNGDTIWTRTFGGSGNEFGYSMQQTMDGGYIICGLTHDVYSYHDSIYLLKSDATGNWLWTKSFGGAFGYQGYSVQQTTDGGYILAGYSSSSQDNLDVNLTRTDANGGLLWTKTYGGATFDAAYSVHQTTDGGYIMTGETLSFGAGGRDVYLIKTDANGDPLWSKTFGGINDEAGASVQQTTDGGYIILGSTTSFGTNGEDIYLIKTSDNGDALWTKTFAGSGGENGRSIQQTMDGGYIMTGGSGYIAGNDDVFLAKTDINGDLLWTKTFEGSGDDGGSSVQQTTDGGYIIAGTTHDLTSPFDDVYLIKTDALGNSGCNQGSIATIVSTPATQSTNPATMISSSGGVFENPVTIVGSGTIVKTICASVGINEIVLDYSFTISPNPSTGNFIVSFEAMIMKGDIEILDLFGKNVFKTNILNESKKEINLKNITQGIYFVKVYDGKKCCCKKIIVE